MNKLFSLSVFPLAATATIASVMMASAPAQALSVGTVNIGTPTGSSFTTNLTNNSLADDSITFSGAGNVTSSSVSGILSSTTVSISDIFLIESFTGNGLYTGNTTNPFLSFANGINFVANNPLEIQTGQLFGKKFAAVQFMGNFVDTINNNQILGSGLLTGQIGTNNSYSITVEAVPEPLTILGTGIALGFGGLFKNKSGKKQAVKA